MDETIIPGAECLNGPHLRRFAKFWVRHKGAYTKLNLRTGARVVLLERREYCDGYAECERVFTFDGARLLESWTETGRDVVGKFNLSGACFAHVAELAAKSPPHWDRSGAGVKVPYWRDWFGKDGAK